MHVPVLRQTDACCHGAAAFDKRRRCCNAAEAIAFSSEVGTGSREENASKQESRALPVLM